MSISFNPDAFFQKTAYYASQGRGQFTLGPKPVVLTTNLTTAEQAIVNAGWPMLQNGIVAKNITTAGFSLSTFEEFSFNGPTRKPAHGQIFGPLNIEFLLIGQDPLHAASVYNTFTLWIEKIAGPQQHPPVGQGNPPNLPLPQGLPIVDTTLFAIEYYQNYVTTAELNIFDPFTVGDLNSDKSVLQHNYTDIYPQSVGGITTSWDNQDAPLTLSVTFEYYYCRSVF